MSTQLSTNFLSSSEADTTALSQLLVKVLQGDTVNSLTLTDPWGTAVALGAKKKETRSWSAPRRYWSKPLAIHISGTLTPEAKMVCHEEPFQAVLEKAGYAKNLCQRFPWSLPLKQVVAVTWLEHVERIERGYSVNPQERSFGNYQLGRYAWNFGSVYRLKQPIVALGHLGIWQWTPPETFWIEVQEALDALREGQVESHV